MSATAALAYGVTRFPATAAAAHAALSELSASMPGFVPAEQLDLGTGTGAALVAARSLWPGVRQLGIEQDGEMARLAALAAGPGAVLEIGSMQAVAAAPSSAYDLVTASYALGELGEAEADAVLAAALRAARRAVLVVEPGTPAGFSRIVRWRERALSRGARVAAPCPHEAACPIEGGDWCHFSVRLGRSRLHRRLKGGEAGFEDEKFSYLALSLGPEEPARAGARVLRHPVVAPGRVGLTLCRPDGLVTETFRRRQPGYREAASSRWGSRR